MSTEKVESDYYEFMNFDRKNARSVLSHYVQYFARGPVLELACGPGVFLDLLAAQGIGCSGVDIDDGMVDECRQNGHEVVLADAIEHLQSVPDASLHGLFAAHFLEHLTAPQVQTVYDEAARVLAPGGVFAAVVPNAACLSILTIDFWRDPTHVRFYDPLALQFFARQAGLSVLESAGNPLNHPGPPPWLIPSDGADCVDIEANVHELVQRTSTALADPRKLGLREQGTAVIDQVTAGIGHLLVVLNQQTMQLAGELGKLRTVNKALVAQLYPPNEVYVVVTKDKVDS